MTQPPRDGSEHDGEQYGEQYGGARDGAPGAQSDPDHMLTQPVQFHDRPPAPPGVQPYGPPARPYGPAAQQYGQAPQPYAAPQPYGAQYPPPQYGPPGSFPPASGATRPKKSRLRLILGLLTLAALLVIAMVLANALGPTVLDRQAVERDVAVQFEERHGVAIDLSCDDQMLLEEGGTYECTGVTADNEEVTLQIEVTDENFAAYTWTEP